MLTRFALVLTAATMISPALASEPVLLHAAASLRSALTEVASAYQAASGQRVQAKYDPSGTLKDEIASGARAEVFASAEGKADIFIAYCTAAREAQNQNAGQQVVALPNNRAAGADYGLRVVSGASPQAYQFALFILSVDGQRVLARHGFAAPGLPQ
jgi:ABC-type molybdate transport system substrate-binding protein